MNADKALLRFALVVTILNLQEASPHKICSKLKLERGARVSIQNPTKITKRGSIVNRTNLRILNSAIITNRGLIRNYNKIVGEGVQGNIVNEGTIINYSSYVPIYTCAENGNQYDFTKTSYGDDLGVADISQIEVDDDLESYYSANTAAYGKAAYYDLAVESGVTEFHDLLGAEIENVAITGNDVQEAISAPDFFSEERRGKAYRVSSNREIILNAGDRIGDDKIDKDCWASFYSVDGYESVDTTTGERTVEAVDSSARIIKMGSETLVLHSDCSWFNGAVEVRDGKLDVLQEAAMFGGTVIIDGANSSVTWRGGAKDPYNKPVIILRDESHLNFNVEENDAFSVYGPISGDRSTTIHFKSGTIYVKSDCSGFSGHLAVDPGAKFVIRSDVGSSGQHYGKMFGGSFEVTDASGEAVIDTSEGVEPLTLTKGTVRIVNDESGNVEVKRITVDREGKAIIDLGPEQQNVILKDATIHGELELFTGEEATFENLDIDGGLIRVTGENLGQLSISGSFKVGSGINMMGNDIIDTIDATNTDRIQVYPGRNFDLWIDLDPASGLADNIIAPNCDFMAGSALNIADYRIISRPVEESYTFKVLTLTDPNARYLPIVIGTDKTVEGAKGLYRLYAEGGDGFITLRTPNATVAKITEALARDLQASQINEINNVNLPLKLMHSSMFSNVSDIYSVVCSESDLIQALKEKGRYRFWDKSFFGTTDFKTTGNLIKAKNYATVFGFDAKPSQMENGAFFMPTVFGAYSAANIEYGGKKGKANEYLAGGKLAWFSSAGSIEALGSYGFLKTQSNHETYGKNNFKSHLFSGGLKLSYNIKLGERVSLIPNVLASYSFIKTKDSKLKDITIKNKNLHYITIAPGLILLIEKGNWNVTLGVRVNGRFNGEMKGFINGNRIISNTQKKTNIEYEANLYRNQKDGIQIGLGVAKSAGGAKGIKIKLNLSAKS